MRTTLCLTLLILFPSSLWAFASGAGTCTVVADFSTITSMNSRTRNETPGPYSVSSNVSHYLPGVPVTLTLNGPTFTGVMFSVVNESGTPVGLFDVSTGVRDCDGTGMSLTHTTSFGSVMSRQLIWNPPATDVGPVYVLGYVLAGTRGMTASQEFYRFVRDDDSALQISSGLLFEDEFESP